MTVNKPADENQGTPDDIVRVSAETLPLMNIELDNFSDIDDFKVNKTFICDSVAHSASNEQDQIADIAKEVSPHVVFEFVDHKQNTSTKNNCNCSQKLMNKMD